MTLELGRPKIGGMDANLIIDKLGGTQAVATMCDVKPPSVSEWRRLGIPKSRLMYLRLLHPEVFDREEERPLIEEAAA